MASETFRIENDIADITDHLYYKKLQQDLQNKKLQQQDQQDQFNDNKVSKLEQLDEQTTKAAKSLDIRDSVRLSRFEWSQDETGDQEIIVQADDKIVTNADIENKGIKILRSIGYKIDFKSRLDELKQSFLHVFVQSRSPKFFVAKFNQFKLGIILQILSVMGVSQEEIQTLQKKALESAIEENIKMMADNIYNIELSELIYGRKKGRAIMAQFLEIRNRLLQQMVLLDKPNYWNKVRYMEERIKQCNRIYYEFKQEKSNLEYRLSFSGYGGIVDGQDI